MNNASSAEMQHSERAITVTTEVEINHAILGYDAYHDWDSEQQADFLAAFATELRTAVAYDGIMQIHYIADALREDPKDLAAVRWLNDKLTDYLAEVDGAPQTQAEVTAGYVNPSQERMAAWAEKQELTR